MKGSPAKRVAHGAGSDDAPRTVVHRESLLLLSDPPELFWQGRLVPLSLLEARLMEALMRRGRLRWEEMADRLGVSAETRDTLIHRIRRKLAAMGASDPIRTVRNWGIMLAVPARGRSTLWIGADERNLPRPVIVAATAWQHDRKEI